MHLHCCGTDYRIAFKSVNQIGGLQHNIILVPTTAGQVVLMAYHTFADLSLQLVPPAYSQQGHVP